MDNKLRLFTWELTQRCNLQCRHCGSDCTSSFLGRELSMEDALHVAKDLGAFEIEKIVFSGGEPLLCPYWKELAQAFCGKIELGMVTNGTLVTKETAKELKHCGFSLISVSMDGMEESHDIRRKKGSFKACLDAVSNILASGLATGVNTTVTKDNIDELPEMFELLRSIGVTSWQLQPAVPSGRMSEHWDELPSENEIWTMIRFAYEHNSSGIHPAIFLSETVGYYSMMETRARQLAYGWDKLPVWKGCPAGINSMGILSTGELVGCISLRDDFFKERNVHELWRDGMTISDYWNSPSAFEWRRKLSSEKLSGKCRECQYAVCCLGGCSNVKFCFNGTLESSNPMCIFY